MYQPLWRIKHDDRDALAIQCPGADATLFVYSSMPDPEQEFGLVEETTVEDLPADRSEVAWFYEIDREMVAGICASALPPADARDADDWLNAVVKELWRRGLLFWEGDCRQDLVALGLVDEEGGQQQQQQQHQQPEEPFECDLMGTDEMEAVGCLGGDDEPYDVRFDEDFDETLDDEEFDVTIG